MNQNFLSTNDRFVNNNNNNNTVFQLIIDRLNSYQSNENYHHYYLPIIDHHHRRRRSIDHPNDDYDDDRNLSIISTEQTIFPSTLTYSTVIKQLLINTDNNNQNVILLSSMASTTTTTTNSPSSSSSLSSSITDQSTVWDPNLITDPLWTTIPMTILYILILVTGVIGNVLTCVVIARNRYMHTATNYYLFSLAISDLLLLVLGLPQEIYQIWYRYPYIFGEAFCILRGFSSEASTNSSVLTITAFTMERYIAICHPLRAHTMSKLSRAIKLIIIIWLLGFLCAAPIAYQFGIVFDYLNDQIPIKQSAACNIKRSIPYLEEHIFALSSLIVFVLPVTWITVLYILIGIKLRQSSKNTNPDLSRNSLRRRRIKRRFRAVTLSKRFIHLASSSAAAHNSTTTTTTSTITSDNISIDENDQQQQQGKQQRSRTLIKDLNEITISSSSSGSINKRLNKNDDVNVETTAAKSSDVMKCFTGTGNHIIQQQESFSIPSSPLMIVEPAANNNNKSFQRQKMKMSKFKSSSTISNSSTSSSNSLAQRRAVIKMLTAVVAAFFICFAPFHAQRLMAIYVKNPSDYETIAFTLLTYISGVTYYLSATINPILYSIMSVRFRQAFHDTFVRTFCSSVSNQFNDHHHHNRGQMYCSTYSHHHSYHQQQQQQQKQHQQKSIINDREKSIIINNNRQTTITIGKQTTKTPKNGITPIDDDDDRSIDNNNPYLNKK